MWVSTLLFLAPQPVPPGQHPPKILRFTHHMQAVKFSLVYRDNIASTYFRQSELKRCCCCHSSHKSKAKV